MVVLVAVDPDVVARLDGRRLADAEHVSADELIVRLATNSTAVDAIVLGPALANPVQLAQRVHALHRELPIVVLTEPELHDRVVRAVQFAPLLGGGVHCLRVDELDRLPEALAEAARHAPHVVEDAQLTPSAPRRARGAAYLGQLLDHAPIGVVSVTADGSVLAWNRRAGEIFGVGERGALSSSLLALFPDGERERVRALLDAVGAGAPGDRALLERNVDGAAQVLETTAVPVHRGRESAVLVLVQDVSDRVHAERSRERAERALREWRDQLAAIFEGVGDGITVQDARGEIVFANSAAVQTLGFGSTEDLLSTPVGDVMQRFDILDEHGDPLPVDRLPGRRALKGEACEETVRYRVRATGEERWSLVKATPIRSLHGDVELAINIFQDVTEQRRAEETLRFLAGASRALAESLDYERTLARVAKLAVPRIADWCVVYVVEADGTVERLAIEHAGGRHEYLNELLRDYPLVPEADAGVPGVLRTGEPLFARTATAEMLVSDIEAPPDVIEELESLGIVSWMCVPLIARGRTLGAISLISAESGRRFGERDLELAEELARRAALAVDNARLYRETQKSARRMQESLALLDTLLTSAPVGLAFVDRDLRYVRVNDSLAAMDGLRAEDIVGRTVRDVIPELAPKVEPFYRQVLETGVPITEVEVSGRSPGTRAAERHWLVSYYPVPGEGGETVGVGAVVVDITERKRAEQELDARARQQASVAALGQLALSSDDLDAFLHEAAERVAETLAVEYAEVLELLPDRASLTLRAGAGWRPGLVGTASVGAGRGSQAGFTLLSSAPVVVEDLRNETRFEGPPLLREHGVVSGMTVVIGRVAEPFGVLGAHTTTSRTFTSDDVNFLQAVANVIAAAIERHRADAELGDALARERDARAKAEEAGARMRFLGEASALLASSLEYETTLASVARLAVPALADWCVVDTVEDDGSLRRLAVEHVDPRKVELGWEMARAYPVDPASRYGPPAVIRTGEPEIREIPPELLAEAARDEEHLRILREIGLTAYMSVPIRSRGRILGAITFVSAESGRLYDGDELRLAEELARRAGVAIDNARLYREVEQRARAAQALTFVADAVFLTDSEGVVRLWNPAAEAITGLPARDVVGRPAAEAISGWSSLEPRVPVAASEAATSARPEALPLDLAGREIWLSISGVRFAEGTVYAFRDITRERGVEKMKSDFVSTVSHELRTPLAAIYGAALTLRRDDVPLDPEQRSNLLTVIAGEADRLARIVNDILWTSRIESENVQITIERCDALELARGVVRTARLHLPESISLELVAQDGLPPLAADPDKVRQVLVNLVENAIKYSPDGGTVEIRVEEGPGVVRFVVTDEGLGIPPDEQELVFEKFYRVDPHLTRGVGGTGLGLYICRELVRRMDGRIGVRSEVGEGSTFVVDLPAAEPVAPGGDDA